VLIGKLAMSHTLTKTIPFDFGPLHLGHNQFQFRLWAPEARQVDLLLYEPTTTKSQTIETLVVERKVSLTVNQEGWFHGEAPAQWGQWYHFVIDNKLNVPDPASRYQPLDVHGPSALVDPEGYPWQTISWQGLPFEEAVFYELHTGTFTPSGTFKGVIEKLDYLKALGINTIELMPVADFPGQFNWGYDGVLLYAPDHTYGHPNELKALIDAAHARGLQVYLDVVYNHFGPEGNYWYVYAQQHFFNARHQTPWGNAINFDGPNNYWVREFFIQNTLFWLSEYRFDGLRLDAVQEIYDDCPVHILDELNQRVQQAFGGRRHVHLVLENDLNQARFLNAVQPMCAQWNDDFHHAGHTWATGENQGYYAEYYERQGPLDYLGKCLAEGFAYQGERSSFRGNIPRGEKCDHLPPKSFVHFIQNHDQVGNRALGERLSTLTDSAHLNLLAALYLLAPSTPMLFMGEEWASQQPFLFFTDLGANLADSIRAGRRQEFVRFAAFADPKALNTIPDPCDVATYQRCILDWVTLTTDAGQQQLKYYQELLALRQTTFLPFYRQLHPHCGRYELLHASNDSAPQGLHVFWSLNKDEKILLWCNFGRTPLTVDFENVTVLYASQCLLTPTLQLEDPLLPMSLLWGHTKTVK